MVAGQIEIEKNDSITEYFKQCRIINFEEPVELNDIFPSIEKLN